MRSEPGEDLEREYSSKKEEKMQIPEARISLVFF